MKYLYFLLLVISVAFCDYDTLSINLVNEADKLISEGSYSLAIEHYEKALQIEPEHAEGLRKIGYAHQLTGNYKQALEYFDYSVFLNRDDVLLWIYIAQSHYFTGEYFESKKSLKKATEIASYDIHKQMIDSLRTNLEYMDSTLLHIQDFNLEDVRKFNENDELLYAYISDFIEGTMEDTVLVFIRGEEFDKHYYIGLAHNGKRHYKETLPKTEFKEYTRYFTKTDKLNQVYINPDGNFVFNIQIEKIIRGNNSESGILQYQYDYSFIDIEVSRKKVCFTQLKDGKSKKLECFDFGIFKGNPNSPVNSE